MDRIVLRAPSNEINVIHRGIRSATLSIPAVVISALVSLHKGSTNSSHDEPHVVFARDAAVHLFLVSFALCLLLQSWNVLSHYFLGFLGSRRFKEAAMEITPFGVQLVSVYGTHSTYGRGHSSGHFKEEHRVRSFLPMQKIIDVIVMEVVWPHCVWSQLAFRVIKRDSCDDACNSSVGIREDDGVIIGAHVPENGANKSMQPSQERYKLSRFCNIHKLLEQDRVAIVPCFPEECRGLLTYKQCLSIQVEIENLLSLPSR
ncbi:hypothetical protein ACHAWX_001505 [Stephanocyclus meneghinianus]